MMNPALEKPHWQCLAKAFAWSNRGHAAVTQTKTFSLPGLSVQAACVLCKGCLHALIRSYVKCQESWINVSLTKQNLLPWLNMSLSSSGRFQRRFYYDYDHAATLSKGQTKWYSQHVVGKGAALSTERHILAIAQHFNSAPYLLFQQAWLGIG